MKCLSPVTLRRDYRREAGVKCGPLDPLPTVRCGRCASCKAEKIDDWVGRALAEAEDCLSANVVTLTYGRSKEGFINHKASKTLNYEDVKLLWKKLRGAGHALRYIVAGQYGDKNGRAHFHAIIYWQGRGKMKGDWKLSPQEIKQLEADYKVPDMTLRTHKIDWVRPTKTGRYATWWDHGFTYIDECHGKAVRYVARYVTREEDGKNPQPLFNCSTRPPIGGKFFERRAADLVEAGLSPQDGNYSPKGSEFLKPRGHQRAYQYRMFNATKRIFVKTFEALWYAKRPGQEIPFSPWLYRAIDAIEKHEARRMRERKSEQERIFYENLEETRRKTKEAADRKALFVAEKKRQARAHLLWPSEVNSPARPAVPLDQYVEATDENIAAAKAELSRRAVEAYWKAHREAELYRLAGDFPAILAKPEKESGADDVRPGGCVAADQGDGGSPPVRRSGSYPRPPSSGVYRLATQSGALGLLGRPLREPSPGDLYRAVKATTRPVERDAKGRRTYPGRSAADYFRS